MARQGEDGKMKRSLKQRFAEYFNISGKLSQSYMGEDILLWRYFNHYNKVKSGFFIDVGAYHPKFYNNTWVLRKRLGFRGINIEPTGIKYFNRFRRDDINLQYAIGDKNGIVKFEYVSEEPAVSGIKRKGRPADKILEIEQVTLSQIVKKYNIEKIDLLDIDVEGTEMNVLRGHDWKIKPTLILIEYDKDKKNNIAKFLINKGYKLIAQNLNNCLYENINN